MNRLIALLPSFVDRRVRVLAWLSLVFQIALIGTGGAVRLTGSGLGCPTWPSCTDSSFVSTPEMGIHGIIEFANRMLTFVLALIVIAAFLSVVRYWRARRDLFVITLLQGLSIPLQAVIGGITVLTGLNPYIVGLHFVISILLVVNATIFVYRAYRGRRGPLRIAPLWALATAHIASLFVAITVIVGILTTGSGPHAGDAKTPRNGLDAELLQHLHSWPAYVLLGLTVVLVIGAIAQKLPMRGWVLTLLGVEALQVVVGLTQARLGLPPLLVGIHMVLAGLLVAAMTAVVLSMRSSSASSQSADAAPVGESATAESTAAR
ncbi:heme A synthase [Agreia sp. COWG]|uniref:COX15/CtaA family protein n=1 Tax=Agreia sp. COWG TaxID=2773266 RepID=UPI001927A1CF|nr:COX15/CtaA family protein [Agreia sp. COWG]CAD5998046.1 Cytochrome oxidase assembly protein [Agreia sp. COWG]